MAFFFFFNYLATAVFQNETGNAADVRALELLWKRHAVDADVTVTCVLPDCSVWTKSQKVLSVLIKLMLCHCLLLYLNTMNDCRCIVMHGHVLVL